MLGIISSLDFSTPGISILLVEPLWGHTTSQKFSQKVRKKVSRLIFVMTLRHAFTHNLVHLSLVLLLCCIGKIHCPMHRDSLKNVLFMSEFLGSIESQRGNSFSYERSAHVWACAPCQLHCGTYFGTPNFFKLTLSWIWTAGLEENRPVKSQFLFKCSLSTVDSARVDWMYVLARVPTEESRKEK